MSIPVASWHQSQSNMAPAYSSVDPRTTFSRPPPHISTSTPSRTATQTSTNTEAPPPRKVVWPPPVRDYVQRSFAPEAKIHGIEYSDLEKKLKQVITEAAEADRLHEVDWATLPLPQQMIQQERAMWNPQFTDQVEDPARTPPSFKKRKFDDPNDSQSPLGRKAKNNNFEDRITYASPSQANRMDKRSKKEKSKYHADKFPDHIAKRIERFGVVTPDYNNTSGANSNDNQVMRGPVAGTCRSLEKNYFRLTSAPKPEDVRPQEVLEQTLELLKRRWKAEGNYTYICDQFKSLRQDLTVQHIKNRFTVDVYELHARIALEKGDMGEYNQCQTQLRALYSLGLGGHPAEFLAYRILYLIHTCNRTGLNDVLAEITAEERKEPAVLHALATRSALALGNYYAFFQLYLNVPNMGAYLMDMFVGRERLAALANICKAYKTSVPLNFIVNQLGFDSSQEAYEFMVAIGVDKAGAFLEECALDPAKGMAVIKSARDAAFKKIDIKGQI
ncbi:hypothetical protein EJ06DRAFT_262292 [Trichodelitschia bisporula]|uniref:PCI domain-containing protein n=1 Tax=Trichodelitschia bisporula TaxID=703511 RepID=A0A6G1HIS1_9PEZI|nr:hypothetical protein EJ06DRAFT_262292 [Trichodelitschia bisporula]